jgi:SAM-dependent methyltransferase
MSPIQIARRLMLGWLPFGPRNCVVCDHAVWGFLPYAGGSRNVPPLLRTLDVVGSDVDNFKCPRCGAHDRERHLLMYLRVAGLLEWMRGKTVAHFAPELRLSRLIAACNPHSYVRCDLYPSQADIQRVDMLSMEFTPGTFDLLIANHVLEHVADDIQALREVARVLKPGGFAILQTPYCRKLQLTWSDPGISDDAARLQAYGQADHVRLFGSDIFERISSVGLESRVQNHRQLLSHVNAAKEGVNGEEPFFLFRKPE